MRSYISLTGILFSFITSGLIASQEITTPIFDKSTKGTLKASCKYYVGGYAGVWASANLFNIKTLSWPNVKQANRQMCRFLLKSTPTTAPVWFGSVLIWHKLYQHRDEQRAALIRKRLEMND